MLFAEGGGEEQKGVSSCRYGDAKALYIITAEAWRGYIYIYIYNIKDSHRFLFFISIFLSLSL